MPKSPVGWVRATPAWYPALSHSFNPHLTLLLHNWSRLLTEACIPSVLRSTKASIVVVNRKQVGQVLCTVVSYGSILITHKAGFSGLHNGTMNEVEVPIQHHNKQTKNKIKNTGGVVTHGR